MEAPEPSRIAFGMMCKAPINGASKTRLCPPLTPAEAAQLSRCFIADVASALDSVPAEVDGFGIAVYTPAGEESALEGLLPQRFGMLLQRGADLGERLQGATEDLLAAGFAGVCLINSDSPTLPAALLERTVEAFRTPGDRIVLGPAIDGGYYLIGLKHPHQPLFDGIPWSTNQVLAQTLARAASLRLPVVMLPTWYDVDDIGTLQLLLHELLGHGVALLAADGLHGSPAANSRAYLQSLLRQEDGARLLVGFAAAHGDWTADYGFVAAALIQGGLYLLAETAVRRAGARRRVLAIVLVVAALLRLTLLFEPPLHSSDIYRYVWDGRVQAAGINPYRFVPADPALEPLRDGAIFPYINRANYAVTIYPPVAQMAFFVFTRLGETLWAVKLGWLALEALAMLALVRLLARLGRPSAELLLYAWHPLPVWEIAGDGHVDAGMAAFLVLALWAWTARRRVATGALLAAAVLIKPLALVALPAFWRRWDWRMPAAFLDTAVLVYLPYLGVGGEVVGFVPAYVGEEGMDSGAGFYVLNLVERLAGPLPAAGSTIYVVAGTALLSALALAAIRDRRSDVATTAGHAQRLLLAGLFVLSPNYPWYFLVLVPLGCLRPWPPALTLTLLSFLLYAAPPIDGHPRTFIMQSVLWGCVVIAFAVDLYCRLRLTRPAGMGADERPLR